LVGARGILTVCGRLKEGASRDASPVLCRKRPSPLASGQRRTWACSIIYVLGQINFLSDKATQPYMAMADVCAAFSVGQSTASAKARVISDALHAHRMDPAWMLPSFAKAFSIGLRSGL
jgi:Domain of unknown function (DUF6398)